MRWHLLISIARESYDSEHLWIPIGGAPMSSSLNVQLTDELRRYVNERASDRDVYATPSEYIRDLIRQDMQDRAVALNILEGMSDLRHGRFSDKSILDLKDEEWGDVPRKSYVLTVRAESDLREARVWSRSRWGKELTSRYFEDLHEGAQYVAENHASFRNRHDLAGGTSLFVYPIREHYLVYEPLGKDFIAVVAVVRQGRDLPTILQKWAAPLRRELVDIRARIQRGELGVAARHGPKPRRKK
jgi:antitoxin ParD1/3/4